MIIYKNENFEIKEKFNLLFVTCINTKETKKLLTNKWYNKNTDWNIHAEKFIANLSWGWY
jgi:hypothetical protein